MKRFSARKIKVGSYTRQGWLLKERESYAVYDRLWKERAKALEGFMMPDEMKSRYMYVRFTEWNNKAYVEAIAAYLNETVGEDIHAQINGAAAADAVLERDVGNCKLGAYSEWCDKFGGGFKAVS